jgi:hypothetical protein
MTTQFLRLRCVRCGDWHEREAGDPYLPEICMRCFGKGMDLHFASGGKYAEALGRFIDRYSRNTERHPTTLALKAWWDACFASLPNVEGPW